jgi:hypothetical protein
MRTVSDFLAGLFELSAKQPLAAGISQNPRDRADLTE